MAIPDWPVGVPAIPLRDDYGISASNLPPHTTQMGGGNTRARPLATVNVMSDKVSLFMTNAQFAAFRAWWRDTITQGTARFNMPVRVDGAEVSKVCQVADGAPFTAAPYGDRDQWKVTFNRRVEDW